VARVRSLCRVTNVALGGASCVIGLQACGAHITGVMALLPTVHAVQLAGARQQMQLRLSTPAGGAGREIMNTKVANDNGVPTSRVRHELNTARFSWYHVKAILVAGVGCACPAGCRALRFGAALPCLPDGVGMACARRIRRSPSLCCHRAIEQQCLFLLVARG